MTFSGRNVLGLNYLLEFIPLAEEQENVINYYMYLEPLIVIYISLHYQFINRYWLPLQIIFLCITIINTIYIIIIMPESPKFLYMNGKFEESRENLKIIAKFNGAFIDIDKGHIYDDFVFDNEAKFILDSEAS
jgi:hypothetical protein